MKNDELSILWVIVGVAFGIPLGKYLFFAIEFHDLLWIIQ